MFATAEIGTVAWVQEGAFIGLALGFILGCLVMSVLIPLRLFGVIGRRKKVAAQEASRSSGPLPLPQFIPRAEDAE